MCRYRRGRSLERRKTKQDSTTKYIWIKESQSTPVLFNQFLFLISQNTWIWDMSSFFPSVQLTISPILKTKEKKIIYTSFFFISTKIKSNTMTNALQKKKLTYIKQVGWSLYYMWTRFLLFKKRHKNKEWDDSYWCVYAYSSLHCAGKFCLCKIFFFFFLNNGINSSFFPAIRAAALT